MQLIWCFVFSLMVIAVSSKHTKHTSLDNNPRLLGKNNGRKKLLIPDTAIAKTNSRSDNGVALNVKAEFCAFLISTTLKWTSMNIGVTSVFIKDPYFLWFDELMDLSETGASFLLLMQAVVSEVFNIWRSFIALNVPRTSPFKSCQVAMNQKWGKLLWQFACSAAETKVQTAKRSLSLLKIYLLSFHLGPVPVL